LDYPPYWIYAAMDPVLTSHNLAALDWARKEYQEIYDLELGVTRVVAKMETYGVRVDVPYMEQKQQDLLTFIQDSKNWLAEQWKLFNPTPLGLVKWFTEQGVKMLEKKTAKGFQAMDKEVLKSIDHPVAKAVLNMRKAEKLLNPYVSSFLNLRDGNDRLHANFWTMGTRTARMSITNPALQTLPKKDTTIRTGVIPTEGHTLISFDMDQVEARLMAHFAGSQTMIDAFTGDKDFFCVVASEIFKAQITDKKDPRRQTSKSGVYGKIYGGGAETLAHVAGVPLADMESFLNGFDRNFPEVARLQWQLQDLAKQRQKQDGESWIRTPTGRRMVADDDMEYTLTNYLIQTHAAEIMKKKLVLLDAVLPAEAHLMLAVHDELLLEAPTEMVADLMPVIQEALDDFDGYRVPLTWGGDVSEKSWGDLVD
jgi:DNA polymerase I-like protein with 3'-5' exonuclease and polymerase domains